MKKVVVIGGGFAGSYAAQNLENHFNVTLVDTKDYFEFTPAVLRAIVEPEHVKKIHAKHKHYLKKAKFEKGKVSRISKDEVHVGKKKIPFDYLLISSGSDYKMFKEGLSKNSRENNFEKQQKKLEDSKKVLIVGGGIVGVELAGEIAGKYPEKKIVLVHSGKELIERQNETARIYAEKFLKGNGAKIIFDDRVKSKKGNLFITEKKEKINADISFFCTGINPNSGFIEKSFSKSTDKRGLAKVNSFLQLKGYENIFVAGDVSGIDEEKTAQNSQENAKAVIRNILNLEKGKPLVRYSPRPRVMVISLGKWDGILTYKNFAITGLIPGLMKTLIEIREMWRYG